MPPSWAYQVDHFQPPPDEELVCSICQSVFCDPVQSPCNHVFCKTCITRWLESNRNCPICRKRTTRSTLQEVVPLVKNMIMKLNLRCHNAGNGCSAMFSLENCEAHIKDCQYEVIKCRNRPCTEMLMRKDIKEHETKHCPHSSVRCELCELRISQCKTKPHDCIKELKEKIKEKNEKLKSNRQTIKKLREEQTNLRDRVYLTSSDSSASPTEILFNFSENSNLSEFSSSSSDQTRSSNSSDIEEMGITWSSNGLPDNLETSLLFNLAARDERFLSSFAQETPSSTVNEEPASNSSVEYPRASSPASFIDNSVIAVESPDRLGEDEPHEIRRPAKRRLHTTILDSSDEDEDNLGIAPQPSRKRLWQLQQDTSSSSSTTPNNYELVAGPSFRPSADSSTSNNDSSPDDRNRFKLRPRARSVVQHTNNVQVSSSTPLSHNGSPIFERTLSLLEQYNLESDPEWLPPSVNNGLHDSDDSDNNMYMLPGHITSSDESSISDLESESSYEDAAENRTEDLLNSFYGSDDSDSEEWLPPH